MVKVDDEDDFLKPLARRLEMRGLKVTGASRGEVAVQLVDKRILILQKKSTEEIENILKSKSW